MGRRERPERFSRKAIARLRRAVVATALLAIAASPGAAQGGINAFPFNPKPPGPFFEPTPRSTTGRARLLSPRADAPYPLIRNTGRNPEQVCDELDAKGFPNLGWKTSALGPWGECLAVTPERAEGQPEPNSIFYMLRGRSRIDQARVKINLPQRKTASDTIKRAEELLDALGTALRIEIPEPVRVSLRNAQPGDFATERVYFSLSREYGIVPRYNLSIDFRPNPRRFYWVPSIGVIVGAPPPRLQAPSPPPLTTSKSPRVGMAPGGPATPTE
jgi:hypothetical protein